MKKTLTLLTCLLALCLLFSACKQETPPAEPHLHTWGEWEIKVEPTCTEEGVERRTCDCGEVEVNTLYPTHCYGTDHLCTLCGEAWIFTDELTFAEIEDGEAYAVAGIHYAADKQNITLPYYFNGKPVTAIYGSQFLYNGLLSVTIPASVTSIYEDAFYGCDSLQSVVFDANSALTAIGDHAFYGCHALTSITLPVHVTSIGEGAFSDCTHLAEINIPTSVTLIDNDAFNNCSSLTSVTVPASVTSIGDRAFATCWRLSKITVPASVTSIGVQAFAGATALKMIVYQGSVSDWQDKVQRGESWDYLVPEYTVCCTDGEIAKDGTVTMVDTDSAKK